MKELNRRMFLAHTPGILATLGALGGASIIPVLAEGQVSERMQRIPRGAPNPGFPGTHRIDRAPNEIIVEAAIGSINNLVRMTHTAGAVPADVRQTHMGLSMLFGELDRVGINQQFDAAIRLHAAQIRDFHPSELQLYNITQRMKLVMPSVEISDVERLAGSIDDSAKNTLLTKPMRAIETEVLSGLSQAEDHVRRQGGVFSYSSLHLQRVNCAFYAVVGGALALAAFFAPEITVAVIAGATITLGEATAMIGVTYGLAAVGHCHG